jgi:hypothetical protein
MIQPINDINKIKIPKNIPGRQIRSPYTIVYCRIQRRIRPYFLRNTCDEGEGEGEGES